MAYDPYPDLELDVKYVELKTLYENSDIVTLHCPLTQGTYHLLDELAFNSMKAGVTIINTSRGGLIDTKALVKALKSKKIGAVGLDVYEEEEHFFAKDLSADILQDDLYARLETFPNVIQTAHQAYFTQEALQDIFNTSYQNMLAYLNGAAINIVSK